MHLLNLATSPELTIAFIIAIVEAFKAIAGDDGKLPIILAVVLGVIFQLGVVTSEQFPVLAPWIDSIYTGIAIGLSAAGFYRLTKRAGKAVLNTVMTTAALRAGVTPVSSATKKTE